MNSQCFYNCWHAPCKGIITMASIDYKNKILTAFDESVDSKQGVRQVYAPYAEWLTSKDFSQLAQKSRDAELLFRRVGITFAVYGEEEGADRLIPFDVIPRILAAREWARLSEGACQRVRALNMFLNDIYHGHDIIKAGIMPESILTNEMYRPEMQGVDVPGGVYAHIAGVDIVRTEADTFYVLEDNLRTPSGVSYMLEDRRMMMRLFPELFRQYSIAPVAPRGSTSDPTVVLMTPGAYNSAYFEHAFLAQQMGIELVEGRDMFVKDNAVFMRTTEGPKRIDVIYRRIDDDFIDPLAFKQDSMLGVPGLVSVYRNGGVALANAIGTGVADDKATYTYVPDMIKFYLGEEPILSNVPTYKLSKLDDRKYVLDNLAQLVVKEVQGSGGYGMLVGPTSSKVQIEEFRLRILANPDNYIAQPTLALSTCPTMVEQGVAPRHVDLRPYVLTGKSTSVVPGALCRVAMNEGSLVVNSSQGGGTKDTWVLQC